MEIVHYKTNGHVAISSPPLVNTEYSPVLCQATSQNNLTTVISDDFPENWSEIPE